MGQAKQRKEEIEQLKSEPWMGVFAYNDVTGDSRLMSMLVDKPVVDSTGMMEVEVMAHMVKKYVARDDELDRMESWHFGNWCYSYAKNCDTIEKQKEHNLGVHVCIGTKEKVTSFIQERAQRLEAQGSKIKFKSGM